MNLDLSGKTALITGGARGIGFATAEMLAAEGVNLVLVDINGESAAAAARTLMERGGKAVGLQADISDPASVAAMLAKAEEAVGPVDMLVNSAAVLDDKAFLESDYADWDRMLKVCLYGPMILLKAVLPGMAARRFGRVVCLASDSARVGQARLSYYAAAKAGVIALVKSVAQEEGKNGITLNVVSPGATNTPLRQEREAGLRAQMGEEKYAKRVNTVLKMYPTGRIGEPQDIAATITFLLSPRASWITGQVVSVNGGFVMP